MVARANESRCLEKDLPTWLTELAYLRDFAWRLENFLLLLQKLDALLLDTDGSSAKGPGMGTRFVACFQTIDHNSIVRNTSKTALSR